MNNKDLFKEAIADAKAVREAALANAKAALEESLTPRLQSMLAAKLQEMEEEDIDESQKSDVEEGFHPEKTSDFTADGNVERKSALQEEDELEEDFDLSEILAELDEAKDDEDKDDKKDDKKEDEPKDDESGESEETEEEEEIEIKDMSIEDLTNLIKDVVSQEMSGGEAAIGDEIGGAELPPIDGEAGIDVNAGAEAPIDGEENISVASEEEDELDEIGLDELLAELDALDEVKDDKKDIDEAKKDKEELDEAIATINILRKELNEQNLLNAKLLYVNKLFKAKNLNESQKVKVIASFDKAKTVKEAKAVFEALQTNLNTATAGKKAIKESLGFASKAAGIAPKTRIVESDEAIARMKKLAGIK